MGPALEVEGSPAVPFKADADRRHHIPRQRHRVTNWAEYDAGLRARGSLTLWFTAEAIEACGGRAADWPGRSAALLCPGDHDGSDAPCRVPPGALGFTRLHGHCYAPDAAEWNAAAFWLGVR